MHERFEEFTQQPAVLNFYEQRAREEGNAANQAQQVVLTQAAALEVPLVHLRDVLEEKEIAPDVRLVDVGAGPTPGTPHDLGKGWVISQFSYRKSLARSIILMKSGELMLGGEVASDESTLRTVQPYHDPKTGKLAAKIDLHDYPIHSMFEKDYGYVDAYWQLPEAAKGKDSPVNRYSPEARVAAHLERLERDLGLFIDARRKELGLPRRPTREEHADGKADDDEAADEEVWL